MFKMISISKICPLEVFFWAPSCLNSVWYTFFRVLLLRGRRLAFVYEAAIENTQISARGAPNWISQRQKAKGDVNKPWNCAKGPGDATSHYVDKSNFRIKQKLIIRFTAHIFFVNSGEVSMSLRNNNQQSLGTFSRLGSEKTALL